MSQKISNEQIWLKLAEIERRISDLEQGGFGTGIFIEGAPPMVKKYIADLEELDQTGDNNE